MTTDDTISASPDVVAREIGDEMVLMDLQSGTYFGLNLVGSFIWERISAEPQTIGSLADAVAARFDATRDDILSDIVDIAEQLQSNGLLAT
ncbi:PqqD family protein [Aurantiacibacter aquimixticola]|uniref:PqqD family protein n=1 Tax=Aurantiacibacter aquimixticola TaxID=1958945 RepID=A0A419RUI3_9SPHN|nr:PqqD family protein [Aurantiacibacter aquimixticola]RJY09448.1 PqqD family protein [Aurantiacibacter aquimixticola]